MLFQSKSVQIGERGLRYPGLAGECSFRIEEQIDEMVGGCDPGQHAGAAGTVGEDAVAVCLFAPALSPLPGKALIDAADGTSLSAAEGRFFRMFHFADGKTMRLDQLSDGSVYCGLSSDNTGVMNGSRGITCFLRNKSDS